MWCLVSADLRELAKAAEGWDEHALSLVWTDPYGTGYAVAADRVGYVALGMIEENAAFIAGANPARVLALLDEVDALRATVARVEALCSTEEARVDALNAKLKAERAGLDEPKGGPHSRWIHAAVLTARQVRAALGGDS